MKNNFVLVWSIRHDESPSRVEKFDSLTKMDDRVNELSLNSKDELIIQFCGKVSQEFEYNKVKKIICVQRSGKK